MEATPSLTPWSENLSELERKLHSNLRKGLSPTVVEESEKVFGKNILSVEKRTSRLRLLLRQFQSPMIYTLLAATVIAYFLGEAIDSIAILLIVVLNGAIGYLQESKAEAAILALKKLTVPKAKVVREGEITTIDSSDVVPGDILHLEAGDYIVADARLVKAYQLSCDEAVLTGESLPMTKKVGEIPSKTDLGDRTNMVFAGTAVSAGSGRAIVTATGMNTEIGHIAGLLKDTQTTSSPLQIRLEKVSHELLKLGVVVILIVIGFGYFKGEAWPEIMMAAISLAVAAIPEGLPTVVTLALTLAVRRMTKRNALVRKMNAVETLGSTDFICTDKTGTLTTGKMRVRETFTTKDGLLDETQKVSAELFYKNLILCNNASVEHGGSGDTTEIALLLLAQEHGHDIRQLKEANPRLHEWSFESDRKRMSVAIAHADGALVLCKGAPESVLPLCQMSAEDRRAVNEVLDTLGNKGRRVLALSSKDIELQNFTDVSYETVERDLTFLGLVSIADPPKKETIPSIRACKSSGIKVVMITGDHPVTANAIARELGIPERGFDKVLTGSELNSLGPENLRKVVEETAVYARVSPEHKLKIIEALQSNGHVVSMTGDGVNDAPALKKASIGVAMGQAGTEVARQASSIILTDDNFSTIVSAVEEGRAIFGNIKRTIQYLLSTNLGELLLMLFAAVFLLPTPLAPLSLLWINLVTDGLPSLALAAEPVEKNFLSTSGRPSPASFFDRKFLTELFSVGILMAVIAFGVYYYALESSDELTAKSYAFSLLVYLCLFRSFSCRSDKRTYFELPFNKWHFISVVIPLILQVGLQYSELFQRLFRVRALSMTENIVLILLGILPVTMIEGIKLLRRK